MFVIKKSIKNNRNKTHLLLKKCIITQALKSFTPLIQKK